VHELVERLAAAGDGRGSDGARGIDVTERDFAIDVELRRNAEDLRHVALGKMRAMVEAKAMLNAGAP
jgi:hypothetical protein